MCLCCCFCGFSRPTNTPNTNHSITPHDNRFSAALPSSIMSMGDDGGGGDHFRRINTSNLGAWGTRACKGRPVGDALCCLKDMYFAIWFLNAVWFFADGGVFFFCQPQTTISRSQNNNPQNRTPHSVTVTDTDRINSQTPPPQSVDTWRISRPSGFLFFLSFLFLFLFLRE
jgi:hypothetical protein